MNGKKLHPDLISWCGLCNSRPSDGILEILFDGEVETQYVEACTPCVVDIPKEEWIMNKDLSGTDD